jgi:predicted ATPase
MIHLRSVSIKPSSKRIDSYPFNIPLIKSFDNVEFNAPMTFLVGENGTGKSTLLEAIAVGIGSVTIGGEDIHRDKSLEHARKLAQHLKLVWQQKTRRGFFLRAEDFFNFARRLNQMNKELDDLALEYDKEFTGSALQRAKGSIQGQKSELVAKYGEDLNANSHGESFLKVFQARFIPGGLYLLDEPEAPLSPLRQLSLLSILKDMVEQDAQFIIVTHSPIIMAFPGASILSFDSCPVKEIGYDELEHVSLTRAFLRNPESFLRHL